jgi:hypothetical protein
MSRSSIWLVALQCSIAACSSAGGAAPCTENSDCPSNFCRADGTCSDATLDAPGTGTDGTMPDGSSGLCTPNHDGMIAQGELPLTAGKMATFRSTTTGAFSTAGTANGDGTHSWDLSTMLTGDADAPLALQSPTGAWWAADFPTATYAVTLSKSSDLLGVFHVDATAVTLLGVVSPTAGSSKTELTYTPPAKVLSLPLTAAGAWISTSAVAGYASGGYSLYWYDEKYTSRVDGIGTMKTPYGMFPVMRVATQLDRTFNSAPALTKRQYGWFAECFGGVATVVSKDNESATEFTTEAEITRIAP